MYQRNLFLAALVGGSIDSGEFRHAERECRVVIPRSCPLRLPRTDGEPKVTRLGHFFHRVVLMCVLLAGVGGSNLAAALTLHTDAATYTPAQGIIVSWSDLPTSATAWIAYAPVGSPDNTVTRWFNTGGAASGQRQFEGTMTTGSFVVRAFKDGGYTKVAESAPFTVQSHLSEVKPVSGAYQIGQQLVIDWKGGSGSAKDWIAYAPAGSDDKTTTRWRYTNGSTAGNLSLEGTVTTGYYVARLFANDSYTKLAESKPFPITVGLSAGTTLESTIQRVQADPNDRWAYSKLSTAPGEPWKTLKLWEDVKDPVNEHPVQAFGHLTDTQIVDHRSPLRLAYADDRDWQWDAETDLSQLWGTGSAYRPYEMLAAHLADASARAINKHKLSAPATGLPLSLTLMTGDLTDNTEYNEMIWGREILNGGAPVAIVSGDPNPTGDKGDLGGEEMQAGYFWHPSLGYFAFSPYNQLNYPVVPDLYAKARAPFVPTGLGTPWYLALGNHDVEVQGNLDVANGSGLIAEFLHVDWVTRSRFPWKLDNPLSAILGKNPSNPVPGPWRESPYLYTAVGDEVIVHIGGLPTYKPKFDGLSEEVHFYETVKTSREFRIVPPDASRKPQWYTEFVKNFVAGQTPGRDVPLGHGFGPNPPEDGHFSWENPRPSYYVIPPGTGPIVYIALDTNRKDGTVRNTGSEGTIDDAQLAWLETQLKVYSRRYRENYEVGNFVRNSDPSVQDKLIVIFAHHPIDSIDKTPDPNINPHDSRYVRLMHLLLRFPNVVAYMSGHLHQNKIKGYGHVYGGQGDNRNGFWDICTAATLDVPNQSRLIEVTKADNGVVSIYTTMLDADAPVVWNGDTSTPAGLTSLGRELAWNDPEEINHFPGDPKAKIPYWRNNRQGSKEEDRNAKLLVPPPPSPKLPVMDSFSNGSPSQGSGTLATLDWSVTDAVSVTITPQVDSPRGVLPTSGSAQISPVRAGEHRYTLCATNLEGTTCADAIVNVPEGTEK